MLIPALDVGGTHVSAGLVDDRTWSLTGPPVRSPLDAQAPAAALLDALAAAASALSAPGRSTWGVGMPDPFDYDTGVGRFHSVGKFEALAGVDVRAGLLDRVEPRPADLRFLNDAEAFLLGEWVLAGAPARGRWAALTLGTGVGSGSMVDGRLVRAGYNVPPTGRVHLLSVDGRPLEDVMSRRALISAYARASGRDGVDVRELAQLARDGDRPAMGVLTHGLGALGRAVAPWLGQFDVAVLGGSMIRSWDVLGPPFEMSLREGGAHPQLMLAGDVEAAALVGAAWHAAGR